MRAVAAFSYFKVQRPRLIVTSCSTQAGLFSYMILIGRGVKTAKTGRIVDFFISPLL